MRQKKLTVYKLDAIVLGEGYADYDPAFRNLVLFKKPKGGEEVELGSHFFWKRNLEKPRKFKIVLVRKWK